MARKPEPEVFSKIEQVTLQKRYSSFLRDYELRNDLSSTQMAELLDIAPQKYSYVKSSTKPYSKLINSLGFLNRMARLKGLSILEFVSMLEGNLESDPAEIPNWLKTVYKAFEHLPYDVRNDFSEVCNFSSNDNSKKLSVLLEIVSLLSSRELNSLKSFREFISSYNNGCEGEQ